MADTKATYSLDQIVNEALLSLPEGQRSVTNKRRFLTFAINGVRQINLLVTDNSVQQVKIVPNNLNRHDYPEDMEQFIALGVPANGQMFYLTRNNEIIKTTTVVGIDESLDSTDEEGVKVNDYEFWNSINSVSNQQGYYTLDDKKREIIINSTQRTELLLIYVSSGVSLSEETKVPARYLEALKAWILWQDIAYDRMAPNNSKLLYKKYYDDAIANVRDVEFPSYREIADAWALGNKLIKGRKWH
jgi:hypothetical protein